MSALLKVRSLFNGLAGPAYFCGCDQQLRTVKMIPRWEHHIRFDPKVGRKVPSRDVLERFKRLGNGMWIRHQVGVYKWRYVKDDKWKHDSLQMHTCSKEECQWLDAMASPYWLRRRHYVNDPYKPYNQRHGLNTPRMDNWNKTMKREHKKILLDDTTIDKHFYNR